MSMSVGASSSNALSYLQSLLQQGSTKDTKKTSGSDPLAALMQAISETGSSSGSTGSATSSATSSTSSTNGTGATCQPFSADAMSALLSAQGDQSANSPSAKLFAKLDADGDGKISKTEFTDAATKAGADSSVASAVFDKIDGDSDGSVSQAELTKADHGGHHHVGKGPPPTDGGSADGSSATDGATTSTTTNADGSTTTTISYADGSKIDMTTAAKASSSSSTGSDSTSSDTSSGSSNNKTAFNLLEQLIKLQSQMLSTASSTISAVA